MIFDCIDCSISRTHIHSPGTVTEVEQVFTTFFFFSYFIGMSFQQKLLAAV